MNARIPVIFAFLGALLCLLVIIYNWKAENFNNYGSQVIKGLLQEDRRGTPENLMKLYDNVEMFVMFIGHGRSGSSIVGSLLDAHPDVIIAHEFDVLANMRSFRKPGVNRNLQKYLLFYRLQQQAESKAMFGPNAAREGGPTDHYSYHVPGQWQGTYRNTIKVIGDKKAGRTANQLQKEKKMADLEDIGAIVGVPMKFIHITRNPYDIIATTLLRNFNARNIAPGEKLDDEKRLNFYMQEILAQAAANEKVRQKYGDAVIDLSHNEFGLAPKKSLMQLCEFLGITCEQDYLDACAKILHGTPSITRDKVVWTEEQKRWVQNEIQKYSFLKEYSFDSP